VKQTCTIIVLLAAMMPAAIGLADAATDNLDRGLPCADLPIIEHTGYALAYSEAHEQAAWVAYHLTDGEVVLKVAKRTDDFRPDPAVSTGSATLADYRRSGYDRGHLAPAADMAWDAVVMSESFYFSNMSPQVPGFNRGIWKTLEEHVRDWAVAFGDVWVVTGPVLEDDLPVIGPNAVAVPRRYYKVLLHEDAGGAMAIGFLADNRKMKAPVASLAVCVDEVEAATGLDFFAALPDSVEDLVESAYDWSYWASAIGAASATALPSSPPTPVITAPPATENAPADGRCAATTKAGTRCKRRATKGRYCWQHAK
jgi:endonuclease G